MRWSICFRPATSVTAFTIRSGIAATGIQVSIRTDSPAGVTRSVAAPPSTSIRVGGVGRTVDSGPRKSGAAPAIRHNTYAFNTRCIAFCSHYYRYFSSVPEHKFLRVQNCPGQVLKRTAKRSGPAEVTIDSPAASSSSVGARLRAAQYTSATACSAEIPDSVSLASRLPSLQAAAHLNLHRQLV